MPPSAMPMPTHATAAQSSFSAGVHDTIWANHQPFSPPDSAASLSPSLGLHLSPTASVATHSNSVGSTTPPAQTPQSSNGSRAGSNAGLKSSQKASAGDQTRASVAVACVQCRSRHLKCDGGAQCSRCRTDNVECTYIKSRRGWKGKRKNKDDNTAPAAPPVAHGE